MSSSISKRFGDIFIHGKHSDGRVNLEFSSHSHGFEIGLVEPEAAERLISAWNALQTEAERLHGYEWMYEDLSE